MKSNLKTQVQSAPPKLKELKNSLDLQGIRYLHTDSVLQSLDLTSTSREIVIIRVMKECGIFEFSAKPSNNFSVVCDCRELRMFDGA
jgi:hypothetical protein